MGNSSILGLSTGAGDYSLALRRLGDEVVTEEDTISGGGPLGVWIVSLVRI